MFQIAAAAVNRATGRPVKQQVITGGMRMGMGIAIRFVKAKKVNGYICRFMEGEKISMNHLL